MPVLEYCAFIALAHKASIMLVVFIDGSCATLTNTEYELNSLNGMADHLSINLNRILQRFFPSADLSRLYTVPLFEVLGEEEQTILRLIQSGKFEEIKVKHKGGKIERLEAVERVDATKRIVDILKQNKYQNIEVIQKDGKVVSIVRRFKHKFS